MSYDDSVDDIVDENSSVFSLLRMRWLTFLHFSFSLFPLFSFCSVQQITHVKIHVASHAVKQGHAGSKTLHQQNPP